eukprot:756487-Hanusia_phi.AAC.6
MALPRSQRSISIARLALGKQPEAGASKRCSERISDQTDILQDLSRLNCSLDIQGSSKRSLDSTGGSSETRNLHGAVKANPLWTTDLTQRNTYRTGSPPNDKAAKPLFKLNHPFGCTGRSYARDVHFQIQIL